MSENKVLMGRKLAVLARMKGVSQGELAQLCGISRISVNRFFRGKSELRVSDLARLLAVLEIDLEELIDQRLKEVMNGQEPVRDQVYQDVALVLQNLEHQVRRTLLEQMAWWGQMSAKSSVMDAARRIQQFVVSRVHLGGS